MASAAALRGGYRRCAIPLTQSGAATSTASSTVVVPTIITQLSGTGSLKQQPHQHQQHQSRCISTHLFSNPTSWHNPLLARNNNVALNIHGHGHGRTTPLDLSTSARALTGDNDMTNPHLDDHLEGEQPLLPADEYDPASVTQEIYQAAQWNQGTGSKGHWDPHLCSRAIDRYELHLKFLLHRLRRNQTSDPNDNDNGNDNGMGFDLSPETKTATEKLLSSNTTERALKTILKMKLHTYSLSRRVRDLERLIGSIGLTPLTDGLSLRLLEANGKAGNVGRTISLLNLRKARNYPPAPHAREFRHAVQSIQSAGLYLRQHRNLYSREKDQPVIDNPTRWLDAILVNMSERGVQLTTEVANKMLDCYSSTGRSGRAVHFFYQVKRDPVDDDGAYYGSYEERRRVLKQAKKLAEVEGSTGSGGVESGSKKIISKEVLPNMPNFHRRKAKVRMKMNILPPYYKIASEVRNRGELVKKPRDDGHITKLEWEKERDWSLPLTAAFAFADSLTYGACGHEPIELNLTSWNTLIKACCYRGALWRAFEILNETMPRNGIEPDAFSYNTILAGLARVGDKDYMKDLLTTMTNKGVPIDKFTVQALVDGQLNAADISGAVTLVQDAFNQHHVLPPYTSHLKIIEFALGNDLVFEAKRHVYFLQQLWKWQPSEGDTAEFRKMMHLTKSNPKLSRKSLQRLFAYFGEELEEKDFF